MFHYAFLFFIFGIIGWMIDTAYRSAVDKNYAPGTWLPFFSIIYATGGLILVLFFRHSALAIHLQIAIGWILMIALEFFSGNLSLKVLKRRLWDYRGSKWNFNGHIDALHSFYWLVLTTLLRLISPQIFIQLTIFVRLYS